MSSHQPRRSPALPILTLPALREHRQASRPALRAALQTQYQALCWRAANPRDPQTTEATTFAMQALAESLPPPPPPA